MVKKSAADGKGRVAVVEDDLFMAKVIVGAVRRSGHEAVLYTNGAAALFAVPGGGFNLVLTDLSMPRLDGLSFLRALRANQALADLPVIVLSGRDSEEEIVAAFEAGATDYLVKPIRTALLTAKLRMYLDYAEPRARAARPQLLSTQLPAADELPLEFGTLRLLELLGHGASGSVYRAEGPDGSVALKLIHPNRTHSADLTRYFREIAALSLIRSRHIVSVQGHGMEMGYHYISMDLVDGGTVDDEIRSGPANRARIIDLGLSVVRGLQALSTWNIIHRDIKPLNILVRRETGDGVLADLGLAKRAGDTSLTTKGEFFGTPHYVAPEVALGATATDSSSDLYSLGATLYHVASGSVPFPGTTPSSILKQSLRGGAKPLSEVDVNEIDEDLSKLVADLMNVDPSLRPPLGETESRFVTLRSA